MTEWGVVGVIIALIGLITAIVTPMVKLIKSITKLTVVVEHTQSNLQELTTDNRDAHKRIWEHSDKQDDQLIDHDKRIVLLEHK